MSRTLLVDDDASFTEATAEILSMLGQHVDVADSVATARELLSKRSYKRVFLDLMLPDGSGFHLLEHIPEKTTAVTIITGHPSIKNQVMNLYGLNVNYLVKPIRLEQFQRLFDEDQSSGKATGPALHFKELIGETPVMKEVCRLIDRVAAADANVMLLGESGVGKEVVARAIHSASKCKGPFVASNCGAFSSELIGSELFGHEKGAFTGAVNRRTGVFEEAEGGTLFLDEITEMPLMMQPNLLRVLETRTVTRVGSTTPIPFNCRIITATNRTEEQIVESNCLREDVWFRLAVFPISIPPLRARKEDIPLLVTGFLGKLNLENNTDFRVDEADMNRLQDYAWPGNIRELRHLLHRAYIMTPQDSETLVFPASISSPFSRQQKQDSPPELVGRTIEDVERQLIMETLARFDHNKTRAAEVLGVSVKTLYNRLSAYEAENEESS